MSTLDPQSALVSSFAIVALAEMGDKSQLVCMSLAARHRHWPVFWGASVALLVLNALAVTVGAGIAAWVPDRVVAAVVAVLFGVYAFQAFTAPAGGGGAAVAEPSGRSIFATTLLFIFAAEIGDKTQLAVAALAGTLDPWAVWLGASAALVLVSALGVWAGRAVLRRVPLAWVHRLSGALFLAFAVAAGWRAATG